MNNYTFKCCPKCGAVLKIDSAACGNLTCPKCQTRSHTRDLIEAQSVVVICPKCSTKLRTYVQNDSHVIRCRTCNHSAPFAEFQRPANSPMSEGVAENRAQHGVSFTEINPLRQQVGEQGDGSATRINANVVKKSTEYDTVIIDGHRVPIYPRTLSMRFFKDEGELMWYGEKDLGRFMEGRQVVGRMGNGADIECPTRDRYFSRTHFAVVVEYISRLGTFRHYVMDNGCENTIRVQRSGETVWHLVSKGDMLIVNAGDHIKVGHTILEIYYK